jgi:hypothetical protein
VLFDRTALKKQYSSTLMFFTFYKIPVNYLIKEPILNVLHLESDKERNEKINNLILQYLLLSLRAGAAENVYITVIAITILCLA